MDNPESIISHFNITGEVAEVTPLGNGLINDTFKVTTLGDAPDYVLQRINNSIFTDVDLLQHNIDLVTAHIRHRLEAEGAEDIDRKVLRFITADTGKSFWQAPDGGYWRLSVFIPRSFTYETVNPQYSYYAGKAFGNFEAMLADMPEELGESIPDFHNMELRRRQLQDAFKENRAGRASEVKDFVAQLKQYGDEMCLAQRLHREGKLPKRICHCDTKVNNMLFDEDGHVLCVIDLDTVMPSLFYSDYGDFLRSAANTVAEDSPEFDRIDVRMDIFEAFTRGYIESASAFLTPLETELLPYAAALFPYMQAVRFLWDYLNGDLYWKTSYPTHNLVRAQNQWHLFLKVREKETEMKAFIGKLYNFAITENNNKQTIGSATASRPHCHKNLK